jgi:excisionase family DNA binding protein
MITASEAARAMGCNRRTLTRLAERGEVPGMRIGNRWIFLPSVLDAWRKEKMMANWVQK